MKERMPHMFSLLAIAVLTASLPDTALAVDGVVLIDQNRALAGNVTPGDAPGFPVTISRAGSYRLSGNLTVPADGTDAIHITVSDVTVDLNGFAIIGPVVCSGVGAVTSCSNVAVGDGVRTSDPANFQNITVRNGTVRGMGNGIFLIAENVIVEKVHAYNNRFGGISIGGTGVVINNTALRNGGRGIVVSGNVRYNVARENGGDGITASGTLDGNISTSNGGDGIRSGVATVVHNTVSNNLGRGLMLFSSGYGGNVISGNLLGAVSGGTSMGHNVCDGSPC